MARVVPADAEHVLRRVRYRRVPANLLSWILLALPVGRGRRSLGSHVRVDFGSHLAPYGGARADAIDEGGRCARNHRSQVDDSIAMDDPETGLRRVAGRKGHVFHERLSLSRTNVHAWASNTLDGLKPGIPPMSVKSSDRLQDVSPARSAGKQALF